LRNYFPINLVIIFSTELISIILSDRLHNVLHKTICLLIIVYIRWNLAIIPHIASEVNQRIIVSTQNSITCFHIILKVFSITPINNLSIFTNNSTSKHILNTRYIICILNNSGITSVVNQKLHLLTLWQNFFYLWKCTCTRSSECIDCLIWISNINHTRTLLSKTLNHFDLTKIEVLWLIAAN
jgi:hypothetical protein